MTDGAGGLAGELGEGPVRTQERETLYPGQCGRDVLQGNRSERLPRLSSTPSVGNAGDREPELSLELEAKLLMRLRLVQAFSPAASA
ncbi:hypothetical protein ASF32_16015 [Methylobacterium sp. Leaf91]|nr:hypothetical protein ASF24_10705 [Methylobacterium sp. Leaf86]KQO97944.1 hypothetical protein ASF32_16015 [Methylobacterium sp. Leaf91]